MIKNKKIIAIVLARAGSKSVKNKNVHKIKGIPLIGYTGKMIKKIKFIDYSVVSTDSYKIGEISKKYGLNFFFKRPKNLSGDRVPDIAPLRHALIQAERQKKMKFDIILSLPPTSPLREKKDVIDCIRKIINKKFDSVWTVSKIDTKYHPEKQLKINKNKLFYYHKNGPKVIARQQLKDLYYRNGAAYAMTRNCLMNKKKLITDNSSFVITKSIQVSIDSYSDISKVSKLI